MTRTLQRSRNLLYSRSAVWLAISAVGGSVALCLGLAACRSSNSTVTTVTVGDSGRSPSPRGQVDVLTQHYDTARTGANLNETVLNTSNVSASTFGKLWSYPVDGLIWAQPLYVSNYALGGKTRNVLIVATGHNSVYAFDADSAGTPLWQVSLGPSIPSAVVRTNNIQIEVGNLSTPVIDREHGLIYISCEDYIGMVQGFSLHVLELATGAEAKGSPVVLKASVPGDILPGEPRPTIADGGLTDGAADAPTESVFLPPEQAQRPALTLVDGSVYLGFASHQGRLPYHGWLMTYRYDAAAGTLTQTHVLNTSPDSRGGGIWQGGNGLVVDRANDIYLMTGSGPITAQNGGLSYGDSFVRLDPSLTIKDWFAPTNWEALAQGDLDLGSGGPLLIPGTHLLAGGGKLGIVYVVNTENMGHIAPNDDSSVVQSFQGTTSTNEQGIWGGPVFWNNVSSARLYVWGSYDDLRAFEFTNGSFNPTPVASSTVTNLPIAPGRQDPVGILAVTSNGSTPGTGIVWGNRANAGPDYATVSGTLYAFDALTLKELWDSDQNRARDDYGSWAKFVAPTVTNGRVYLATHSNQLVVYGLLDDGPAPAP